MLRVMKLLDNQTNCITINSAYSPEIGLLYTVGYFGLSLTGNYWLFTLLQRYRYIQAYEVDLKVQKIEEAFVSETRIGDEVMSRMQSQSHWRKELVVSIPATFP